MRKSVISADMGRDWQGSPIEMLHILYHDGRRTIGVSGGGHLSLFGRDLSGALGYIARLKEVPYSN